MAYYFFKTVVDKGRNRLRPLAGQRLPDGRVVDQTYNVQSDKTIRSEYPIGTTFGSDSLTESAGFYTAGQIYPLGIADSDYRKESDKPNEAMKRAYESYLGVGEVDYSGFRKSDDTEEAKKPAKFRLSFRAKLKKNKDFAVPKALDGFYVSDKDWYLLLRNILNQKNTMMIGPTGTGKTELILLACKTLDIPCHVYDMGSMYDPVAGLLGVHRLQKGGESIFDYAQFTKDIAQPGVVLLDELSRAPVTTNNILFPCLDSRRTLPVEIAGGDDLRSIKVHPDCCFIATANVGAEYTGTMSMDRALVGRFFPIELDYMPAEAEINVITTRCDIDPDEAKNIVAVANNVRTLYKKQEISCSLSTRETLMAAELVADGWTPLEAMELVFLPLFEGTKVEGERGIIAKSLMVR